MTDIDSPAAEGPAAPDRTKRNVVLLAICQALAQSGSSLTAVIAALAGYLIAEDKSLATLPMACQFLGTMLSTIPASFFMRRVGRRVGFTVGQCFGVLGAGLSVYALFVVNFPLLVFAAGLLGVHNAFWQYYRFAATDTASEEYRSRAISYVLAGGVVAAFIGPELAKLSVDFFEPVKFAGGYAAVIVIILIAMTVMQFVDIPKPTAEERSRSGRPLLEIVRQPKFVVAILSAMLSYAVMILMMTATPLAMQFCGHSFDDTAFVIEWHMVGMFAPSFFTGHLIKRFGVLNVITVGALLMFGSSAISLSGVAVSQFWGGRCSCSASAGTSCSSAGRPWSSRPTGRRSAPRCRRSTISRSSPSSRSPVSPPARSSTNWAGIGSAPAWWRRCCWSCWRPSGCAG